MSKESLKPTENLKADLESHGTILDSWYESREDVEGEIDDLKEKIKGLRSKLKKIDDERKGQPPIISKSNLGTEFIVTRYQIIDIAKGLILAEEKKEQRD